MNLNKVFLVGRLTQDPDVRSTPSGQSVATIKLATNSVWNDRTSGQKKESTEFHTIVAWGRLAEIAGQYLKKGGLAMFEGRLQTRSWVGQDNLKRYSTEIVAENLQLGPRSMNAGGFSGEAPVASSTTARRPAFQASAPVTSSAPVSEPEIPIINEDELTRQGVEEGEMPLKDDLPF